MSFNTKVKITDTTLRDGLQSPGCNLDIEKKIKILDHLIKLNVDVIELGFPASSNQDFQDVKDLVKYTNNIKPDNSPILMVLSRCKKSDILKSYQSLEYAKEKRLHLFIATSDIHLKYKLKITREELKKIIIDSFLYAKSLDSNLNISFCAEDATRTDVLFLIEIYSLVIELGASIINIADTTGFLNPNEYCYLIKLLKANVKNINQVELSVHCHNDLGLAVANSLASLEFGISYIECTINGIGERAGNASLEEVVLNLEIKKNYYNTILKFPKENLLTTINLKEIYNTALLVSNLTTIPIQYNKAFVGKNAFLHESGIHQQGVINNPSCYELIDPKKLGINKSNIYLGRNSGINGLQYFLVQNNINLDSEKLNICFKKLKEISCQPNFDSQEILFFANKLIK